MKLLWVKTDFLHPTTRGGQIRTLEMLRHLHRQHEVHYVGFRGPSESEGVERSSEYCTRAYPIEFDALEKTSWRFGGQLIGGLFDPVPLAVSRYRSPAMRQMVDGLRRDVRFDRVVCDFLAPAVNFTSLRGVILFQHNVETMIWRRRVEHARNAAERAYFQLQAHRMFHYERRICQAADGVIAVSEADTGRMREMFSVDKIGEVGTGVNLEYFQRPADTPAAGMDLIFVGSMDWAPNSDGILYFVSEILPLIRQQRPATRLTVVGRSPGPEIQALAAADPGIAVTGTVPDVRPYLWDAKVSIVPLRIGGGTRLKIYEAMAAKTPTVSTRVGAEGIPAEHPTTIRLADEPRDFAHHCVELLEQGPARDAMAEAAWEMVNRNGSWETVTRQFEERMDRFSAQPLSL